MFSASLKAVLALVLAVLLGVSLPTVAQARELRVCADPNNLPFSNSAEQGFENRIVHIVADELGADLSYVWWAQRRGFISNALNADLCDLIAGISDVPGLLLTYPAYYRSSYVFVTRADQEPIRSFDDPRLKTLQIGIQLVGEESSTPPAAALAGRSITQNVHGYSLLADYRTPNPPAAIIDALARGEIDVAVVWGPLAGYFAAQHEGLAVTPTQHPFERPELPMAFDVAMGLRLDEGALRQEIEGALTRRRSDIDAVLAQYHVPRLDHPRREGSAR